jgi:hypothetical protein
LSKQNDDQTGGGKKVIEEFKAARREKREARRAWLERAYQAGEKPTTREQPDRFALIASMKGDRGKKIPPESLKRARAYLAAMERCAEVRKVVRTTLGV